MTDTRTREVGLAAAALVAFLLVVAVMVWTFEHDGLIKLFLVPEALLAIVLSFGIGDSIQLKDRSERRRP